MVLVLLKLMKNLLFISAELRFASFIHFSLIKAASYRLLYQRNKALYRKRVYKKKLLGPVTEAMLPSTQVRNCNEWLNSLALILMEKSLVS